MVEDLYTFQNELNQNGVIFCFNGPASHDLLLSIGDGLKQKMKENGACSATTHKVFSVFVEQMQNIIRYSAKKIECASTHRELRFGVVIVGYINNTYYVTCGNLIETRNCEKFAELLENIQKMDKEQLKTFYKDKRKSGSLKDSKGAGLGLIEVARKAGRPIEFSFQKVDNRLSFFSCKAEIRENED